MTLQQLVDACGWTLLHSVWQIAAIALLLAVALRMTSIERCNARYLSACVALMAMIVAVAGTFAWQMNVAPAPVAVQSAVYGAEVPSPLSIAPAGIAATIPKNVSPAISTASTDGQDRVTQTEPISWRAAIESWLAPWIAPIVALWVVGVSLLSLRLCANWLAVRRLRASGCTIAEPVWTRILTRIEKRLAISRPVALLQSSAAAVPMVIGWLKPVVLVPMELVSGLTSAEIEAILAHELAHIRRHDYLVNLLQNIAETLLFYHPAVWWVSRQIRREREFCCDDVAAQLCEGTAAYARALATVETMRGLPPALSVAASGGSLLDRIRRLAGREPRQAVGASGVMAGVLVVCAVVLLVCAIAQASDGDEAAKLSDEEATAIARKAHRAAAQLDKLPRFYYEAKFRNGDVTMMQEIDTISIENLQKALSGTVNEEKWVNLEYIVAWDPERMFYSYRRYSNSNKSNAEVTKSLAEYFGAQTEGWAREQWDTERPPRYYRRKSIGEFWESSLPLGMDYFGVTPREFWWGNNFGHNQGLSPVPPTVVSYRHLGTEQFGGELCDVVESKGRSERLWIGRDSGFIRGSLKYICQGRIPQLHEMPALQEIAERIAGRSFASNKEYREWLNEQDKQLSSAQQAEWTKAWNEAYFDLESPDFFRRLSNLVVYSDYREIAPGVMFPFREDRARWLHNDEKFKYIRSETRVEKIALNIDLAERIQKLAPKKGDKVQDQRFAATIEYDYDPELTGEDLQPLVEAKQAELAEGQRLLKELAEPMEKMVGQPAPDLSAEDWIGERPELAGKPYLIHFWATWCGPCKNDLPILKNVAKNHQIIGIHPAGTPVEEITKFVEEEKLGYPTLVAQKSGDELVADYPVKMYPYCVVVGADGKVAAHGRLGVELMDKLREAEELAQASVPPGFRHMTVRTVDDTGKPVPNTRIYVSIWPDEDGKYKTSKENYFTDVNGETRVLVPDPPRLFRVWTQKDGYVPLFANWQGWPEQQPEGDQIPEEFTFELPTGTKIGGTIVNDEGKPIAGATVEVQLVVDYANGDPALRQRPVASIWLAETPGPGSNPCITDTQGRWSLNNIPAKDDVQVNVKLTHPEYISDTNWGSLQVEQRVTMESLRNETAKIAMHSGPKAKGTVTDADGKPVANALVIWGDDPYMQEGSQEVRTNAEGVYELSPLTPGVYAVTVVAEGWRPELSIVEIEDEMPAADFELKKGNVLRIKFVDENGQPIPEVNVFIREWRGKESLYNHRHPNVLDTRIPVQADNEGIYEWRWAPPDEVKYSFGKKGFHATEMILIADGEEYVVELTRE